ncbi:MAG: energy-coupling factor ABC transporter ATP-binding protein [Treponema sp.]|nr:energy-coupling factor ABC transporter ATP-binding protein [Treponema sp.]
MIELINITKRFPINDGLSINNRQIRGGFFYALDDISLSIKSGSRAIIAGGNGCGKSLLMSIIAGLEEPTSGTVKTSEKPGLIFQEADSQILGETPAEDIAFGPRNMKLKKEEIQNRVEYALAETGLNEKAYFPARSLSGGEKRRLAAAGIIAMNRQIIIFDEPYANLDFPGISQVNRLIKKLISQGITLIILTHELEKCMALCDHFIVLSGGKKVFDGNPESALLQDLESWGIHHPLGNAKNKLDDLIW